MVTQQWNFKQWNFKRTIIHSIFFAYTLVTNLLKAFQRKLKMMLFYQRRPLIAFFSEPIAKTDRPKVLVNIAHIAAAEDARDSRKATHKVEKLKQAIDGLLFSFAHCDLTIVITSLAGRNVIRYLPEYQQQRVHLRLEPNCDPLYIGFSIQDELIKNADNFDWFLFIEDDIVINDSCFLDKIIAFNQYATLQDVLLPNRYEFLEGTKRYIDLTIDSELAWNRMSAIEIDDAKFAECSNPHSGLYCLSQAQIKHWQRSWRALRNHNIMVSPLESAATFCLLECFNLYKPHPKNLHYLEVQHYDTKYSKLYPEPHSPYTLMPVKVF